MGGWVTPSEAGGVVVVVVAMEATAKLYLCGTRAASIPSILNNLQE